MSNSSIGILDSQSNALVELNYKVVDPGEEAFFNIKYQNLSNKTITGAIHNPFPGMSGDSFINDIGEAVKTMRIMRETIQGVKQVSTINKEDSNSGLTPYEQRCYCLEYNGSQYTIRNTGAVNFMTSSSGKVYLFCNEKNPNIRVKLATPGSYTNFKIRLSGEGGFIDTNFVDGTAGLTIDGVIQIDLETAISLWRKVRIDDTTNNITTWAYVVEFSCEAVETPAVTIANGLYWEYAYNLPKSCLLNNGKYYIKSGEPATYSELLPAFEYGNMGKVAFYTDPFDGYVNASLVCEIDFKNPQPDVYQIDVVSASTVTVNGGSEIGVSTIAGNKNTHIIPGCEINLNTTLTPGDRTTVKISSMLKYLWVSITGDPDSYLNKDVDLGNLEPGGTIDLYTKFSPPFDSEETENEWFFELYASGV